MVSSFSQLANYVPAHFKLWPSLRTADGSLQRQRKRRGFQSGSNSPGTDTIPTPGLKFINPNHDNWAPVLVLPTVDRRSCHSRRWRFLLQSEPDQTDFTLATTNPPFGVTQCSATLRRPCFLLASNAGSGTNSHNVFGSVSPRIPICRRRNVPVDLGVGVSLEERGL